MPEYMVIWSIEIDAANPEDAARKALAIQRDTESWALVFHVQDEHDIETVVDLMDEPDNT